MSTMNVSGDVFASKVYGLDTFGILKSTAIAAIGMM